MKIAYCSDLHLEFKPLSLTSIDADVLVIAGDLVPLFYITYFNYPGPYYHIKRFFDEVTKRYNNVIWVLGNHEFYDYNLSRISEIKKIFLEYDNLFILDNETVTIDGVKFAGGTKWTNMNNSDPLTMLEAKNYMMDFRLITTGADNKAFTSEQWLDLNKTFMLFINQHTDSDVVVTHHSPSFRTTLDIYKNEICANGYYCDSLDEFILDSNFKLWLFGHQHGSNDIDIGSCKIRANARGYPSEKIFKNFHLKTIDI
jgi:Icc-related predicted phosphoesterase